MTALRQLSRLIRATGPHSFRILAISSCPPRKPIASHRLIYSHAFVTVTRLCDVAPIFPPCTFSLVLPRGPARRNARPYVPLFFFSLLQTPSVPSRAEQVSPLPRSSLFPAIFPARGLFAPSAGPLSYFPPGNIAPTRKTIPGIGGRGARGGRKRGTIGPGEIGEVLSRNNICIRERLSSLISSRAFYPG